MKRMKYIWLVISPFLVPTAAWLSAKMSSNLQKSKDPNYVLQQELRDATYVEVQVGENIPLPDGSSLLGKSVPLSNKDSQDLIKSMKVQKVTSFSMSGKFRTLTFHRTSKPDTYITAWDGYWLMTNEGWWDDYTVCLTPESQAQLAQILQRYNFQLKG